MNGFQFSGSKSMSNYSLIRVTLLFIMKFLVFPPEFLQTYEEPSIRTWLQDGHQTCPRANEQLPHTMLIPNLSIKKMISNWCEVHRVEISRTTKLNDDEHYEAKPNREHLIELLEKLSSSPTSDLTRAVKELRFLTTRLPYFRSLFAEVKDAIPQLLNPILIDVAYSDSCLHDDLVATVMNISTHESNKRKIVMESPLAVSFLVQSLRNENIEIRSHSAAALCSLSALDSNKDVIGKSGAITSLIELIKEGHPLALKDATLAISNLCTVIDNRERAVRGGVTIAIMDKIMDRVLIDEMLEILAMVPGNERAVEEMEEYGLVLWLFGMMRESDCSERNKENCVAIVYAMCFGDRAKLRKMSEVEKAYETLSRVARTGNSRARRKASGILERMNRFAFVSHTA